MELKDPQPQLLILMDHDVQTHMKCQLKPFHLQMKSIPQYVGSDSLPGSCHWFHGNVSLMDPIFIVKMQTFDTLHCRIIIPCTWTVSTRRSEPWVWGCANGWGPLTAWYFVSCGWACLRGAGTSRVRVMSFTASRDGTPSYCPARPPKECGAWELQNSDN